MQREFLSESRVEVGQSTALKALASLKLRKDEEILAYIRRFDLMCTHSVGTMLNNGTLKQFFIQGFFKLGTIRSVLQWNLQILADVKIVAKEMEHIDKDNKWLWKKEDESIP